LSKEDKRKKRSEATYGGEVVNVPFVSLVGWGKAEKQACSLTGI